MNALSPLVPSAVRVAADDLDLAVSSLEMKFAMSRLTGDLRVSTLAPFQASTDVDLPQGGKALRVCKLA
jgi:hypothetical protein